MHLSQIFIASSCKIITVGLSVSKPCIKGNLHVVLAAWFLIATALLFFFFLPRLIFVCKHQCWHFHEWCGRSAHSSPV